MNYKLSTLQKVILVFIGVTTKSENKRYMKRTDVTTGLKKILVKEGNSFNVMLTVAVNNLQGKKLICRMRSSVGLSKEGKEVAREIIEEIKQKYEIASWDTLRLYYDER